MNHGRILRVVQLEAEKECLVPIGHGYGDLSVDANDGLLSVPDPLNLDVSRRISSFLLRRRLVLLCFGDVFLELSRIQFLHRLTTLVKVIVLIFFNGLLVKFRCDILLVSTLGQKINGRGCFMLERVPIYDLLISVVRLHRSRFEPNHVLIHVNHVLIIAHFSRIRVEGLDSNALLLIRYLYLFLYLLHRDWNRSYAPAAVRAKRLALICVQQVPLGAKFILDRVDWLALVALNADAVLGLELCLRRLSFHLDLELV